jgi:3-hydroxyisobutyrate dehydrogenase-like beta-hydroxyacid dehydrogenase
MAKLLNNALTVSNLRNVVEVFSLAAGAGVELRALQGALAFSSGGSFILQALGRQITPQIAEHIAHLNVKDVEEFGAAMSHIGMSADVLVNWALEGPKGLPRLVRMLEAASSEATTSTH